MKHRTFVTHYASSLQLKIKFKSYHGGYQRVAWRIQENNKFNIDTDEEDEEEESKINFDIMIQKNLSKDKDGKPKKQKEK
jgi:hypothetical protein